MDLEPIDCLRDASGECITDDEGNAEYPGDYFVTVVPDGVSGGGTYGSVEGGGSPLDGIDVTQNGPQDSGRTPQERPVRGLFEPPRFLGVRGGVRPSPLVRNSATDYNCLGKAFKANMKMTLDLPQGFAAGLVGKLTSYSGTAALFNAEGAGLLGASRAFATGQAWTIGGMEVGLVEGGVISAAVGAANYVVAVPAFHLGVAVGSFFNVTVFAPVDCGD